MSAFGAWAEIYATGCRLTSSNGHYAGGIFRPVDPVSDLGDGMKNADRADSAEKSQVAPNR